LDSGDSASQLNSFLSQAPPATGKWEHVSPKRIRFARDSQSGDDIDLSFDVIGVLFGWI